jgi:NAD(P)-dependent dehydrogenase (short-subunit alcohol dehydrogenase family)
MSNQLQGKIAIVTGAASGIGKEIALLYAKEGAKVAIADMNLAAAQAAADSIGPSAMAVAMDVADEGQVNAAVAQVVAAWGGVDILVSNAGIQIVHPLEDFPFCRVEEDDRDPPRRRLPDDQGVPAAHVRVGTRRQPDLHGLGPLEGSVDAEGAVRRRQARPDRPGQGDGQGRRQARRPRQRHLPRASCGRRWSTSRSPSSRRRSASARTTSSRR